MIDLTKMNFTELHQYKNTVQVTKPYGRKQWYEVDRITAEIKRQDKEKK